MASISRHTSPCQPAKSARHSSRVPCAVHELDLPIVALDHADEIEQLAAPQRVVDDVAAGADPVGAGKRHAADGQPLARDDAAPGHEAGELGPGGAEHGRAHGGMHAVGADQQAALRASAVLEAETDGVGATLQADAARAHVDCLRLARLYRVGEQPMQVATVDEEVGGAVALLGHDAQVEQLPGAPASPVPDLLGVGPHRAGVEGGREAEGDEHAGAVGADLHAGADLAQLGCLLVDLDVDAALQAGRARR